MFRQRQDKILAGAAVHAEEWLDEARSEKISQSAIECVACSVMVFVPGGERRNDNAGIRRFHRRMCSKVSRTASAVSVGSPISGSESKTFPRVIRVPTWSFNGLGRESLA